MSTEDSRPVVIKLDDEWRHTPGAGWARAKAELGDMVPDITEEDERAVDEMLDPAAKRCPCCGKTRLMHAVFSVCKPCATGLGWDPHCEACTVDARGQDSTGMEHVPTCAVSVPRPVDAPGYTDADVEHLAEVIHDARARGIWHGNYTLARWILDHWKPGGTT